MTFRSLQKDCSFFGHFFGGSNIMIYKVYIINKKTVSKQIVPRFYSQKISSVENPLLDGLPQSCFLLHYPKICKLILALS